MNILQKITYKCIILISKVSLSQKGAMEVNRNYLGHLGFTMAEVLITLGIIGIVAAMTLPTLVQNNKNKEVEAKLKKIYSVMNQAILMSENDNGPKEYWTFSCGTDESGNINSEECKKGIEKFFLPYLKFTKTENFFHSLGYNTAIYFSDGSVLVGKINKNGVNGLDFFFYPNGKNFNKDTFGTTGENGNIIRVDSGITFFAFRFSPSLDSESNKFHYKKGFEPYKWDLKELTVEKMTANSSYACKKDATIKVWCTALIQLNNWQIPKDYPFKVK